MLKIMKLLVEGVTSRVADHIWGGCGPPSEYTQSVYVLYLENHHFLAFKFQTISTEYHLKAKKFCILPGGGPPRQRVVDSLEKKSNQTFGIGYIFFRHWDCFFYILGLGIFMFFGQVEFVESMHYAEVEKLGLKWSTLTSHFSAHFCTKGSPHEKSATSIWALPKLRLPPPPRTQPGTLGHFIFRPI